MTPTEKPKTPTTEKPKTPELFRPFNEKPEFLLPVSPIDDLEWHFDGDELSLVVKGKSPGFHGEEAHIWVSIEERPPYCDRGHYLVKIHTGGPALCLDMADHRPNYYMSFEVAKEETEKWLRWRITKKREERMGEISTMKFKPENWMANDED